MARSSWWFYGTDLLWVFDVLLCFHEVLHDHLNWNMLWRVWFIQTLPVRDNFVVASSYRLLFFDSVVSPRFSCQNTSSQFSAMFCSSSDSADLTVCWGWVCYGCRGLLPELSFFCCSPWLAFLFFLGLPQHLSPPILQSHGFRICFSVVQLGYPCFLHSIFLRVFLITNRRSIAAGSFFSARALFGSHRFGFYSNREMTFSVFHSFYNVLEPFRPGTNLVFPLGFWDLGLSKLGHLGFRD